MEPNWQWLSDSLDRLRANAANLAIFVIANIKGVTVVKDDYDGFSVHNDYMTERVILDIVQSLRNIGCYVELFVGESAFMQAVFNGKIDNIGRKYKLAFNLAQSGTGPARKSLIPCFCNLMRIPYCNSDGHVVALLRHKYHATSLLRDHGIPVPRTWLIQESGEWLDGARPHDGLRVIVKPTYEAACIGLSRECVRTSGADLDEFARRHACVMRQPLTVQEFISGYEVDIPVYFVPDAFAPMAVGIDVDGNRNLDYDFLDYETLNKRSYGFFQFSDINHPVAEEMCRVAERAARILGIKGYGRIDFRVSPAGAFYVIDMQTMPDIHTQSSIQYALISGSITRNEVYTALMALNCRQLNLF